MKMLMRYRKMREARRLARLEQLGANAQTVYHFLSDPSQREIARALNMPKSTVNDAIRRLKKSGLNAGGWELA